MLTNIQIKTNTNKIRILHIIASPSIGGAEKLLLTLLKKLNGKKFDVVLGIFVHKHGTNNLLCKEVIKLGLTFEPIRIKNTYGLTQILDLYRIIKKHRPHVIHTHGYKTNILGFVMAKVFRIPIVATFHGWFYAQKLKTKLIAQASIRMLSYFDSIITVSDQIKIGLITLGIPSEKMTTVRNVPAIEPEIYSLEKDTFSKDIGIPSGSKTVGFVGRLEPVKGCRHFIQAVSIVVKSDPDVCFVIVGEGSERESLERQSRKHGLENRVYFCGFRDDMASVFRALDLYVLPSLNEGVPLTLLEAMFYGVPVIATRVGGVPEVIRHGINGMLVSPKDSQGLAKSIVESLINQEETVERVLKAKNTIDREFSVEKWADIIGGIYVNLMKRHGFLNGKPK